MDRMIIFVDYSKTIVEVIANGNYDWADSKINEENFPISPVLARQQNRLIGKLFPFHGKTVSEIILKMDEAGYRPANLMELLTFGVVSPKSQEIFVIAAFSSRTYSSREICLIPCLGSFENQRKAYLVWDKSLDVFNCLLGIQK